MSKLTVARLYLFRAILVTLSVLIFLVLLELISRFYYHPEKVFYEGIFTYSARQVYALKKNFSGYFEDKPVLTNSFGFRDAEIPVKKASEDVRVAMIGDSVTFGHGVFAAETFSEQLESQLQATVPGKKISVINTGVPGYSSHEEYFQLQNALALKPDIAIIQFTLNDVDEPYFFRTELGGTGEDYHKVVEVAPLHYYLSQHSAGYLFLQDMKTRLRFGTGDKAAIKAQAKKIEVASTGEIIDGPDSVQLNKEWQNYFLWLGKMLDTCKRQRMTCYVLVSPYLHQMDRPDIYAMPQKQVTSYVQQRGFTAIDLLPLLREQVRQDVINEKKLPVDTTFDALLDQSPELVKKAQDSLSIDDVHYTPAGHQFIANTLYTVLKKLSDFD